jgi:Fe-S cluster assembly protein SufD
MSWETNYLNFKSTSALDSLKATEKRQHAFESFIQQGLPTKRDEAWKYTSLGDFKAIEWKLNQPEEEFLSHEQMREISKNLPSEFINFVFVNGFLNATLSDDSDSLLEITSLEETDFNQQNVEERILNLAQAFLNKKIKLNVAKGKTVDKPVHVVFVQSSKNPVYSSEKLDIFLDENSEAQVLVSSFSLEGTTISALNLNVNIKMEKSARLTFVQLQSESIGSFHISQCETEVDSRAQLTSLVLSLGSHLIRNYYSLKFKGEHASAAVYGLGVIDGEQHLDNYTFIQHSIGNNESIQHYKSVLSGAAHSVFRGRVLIAPDAQKANSSQLNNNLLLTRTAQADSVPQLEIFADDVKAGHGSTVGQLNKDEIFYFLSRGINQFQAVKMLSYGFAKELVYKIRNEELQNYLIAALNTKLEHMVQNA